MEQNIPFFALPHPSRRAPDGVATLRGSRAFPALRGQVLFHQTSHGVLVTARVAGLPDPPGNCSAPVFGFHIHSGGSCTGNDTDAFADALTHYNPHNCPHPYHAGDLPPLFGNGGMAYLSVLTDRFTVKEIIGRTVIIHSAPDDFTTQPAGNAGRKIACGTVRKGQNSPA